MPGKYVLSKAAKEPSAPHRRTPFPGDGGNLLVYVELGQVGAQDLLQHFTLFAWRACAHFTLMADRMEAR
jgi:hypothetical protein